MNTIGKGGCQSRFDTRVEESSKISLPLELRPCVDLRINLSQILSREALLENPLFHGERLARRLFLKSDDCPCTSIYLRIFPQSDRVIYELVDPLALDLKKCDYVFSQIFGFQNHIGFLEELAAPSFSGKQAITVLLNIMALTEIQELLLGDGSIRLPCCPNGPPAPLRLTEAFCRGKSWYEEQGATAKISATALRFIFTEEGVLKENLDARLSKTKDLDRRSFEYYTLQCQEWQPSSQAYEQATHFLHTVQITSLTSCLSQLCSKYSQLEPFYEALRQGSFRGSSSDGSVAGLLVELMKTQSPHSHKILHELLERCVANKDSIFFHFIADKLCTSTCVDGVSLMLAFCVLGHFYQDVQKKVVAARSFVNEVLKAHDGEDNSLKEKVDQLHEKRLTLPAELLENPREISFVKVWSHATKVQLERYWSYTNNIGTKDEFLTLQKALQYLMQIPLQQLRVAYKDLAERIMQHFHLTETDCLTGITLKSVMDSAATTGRDWIVDELMSGALKHLSRLLVQHFRSKQPIAEDQFYAIFMLCKYVVQSHEVFAIRS